MKILLIVFCSLLLFVTLLPFVKKEYWIFRVCDYPRLQKLVLSSTAVLLLAFYIPKQDFLLNILLVLMVLNSAYLLYLIIPFTKIARVQVLSAENEILEDGISLMTSNVLQDNKNYKGCLAEIERVNPDVVLLLEIDDTWNFQMKSLEEVFPYTIKVPLNNKYGMSLYSKLKLEKTEVHYMVESDIPSIHTQIILKSGQCIQLFAVHPKPPVPNENPSSKERDKELLLVADLAKASKIPVIVMGDLNDVAWSYTTELFLKMSGLLDPRRGRGFFNTFNAHHSFLRFPLDHAFISTDWKLKQIARLQNFDSDHFPIFIRLQYEKKAHLEQQGLVPDVEDVQVAEDKKVG